MADLHSCQQKSPQNVPRRCWSHLDFGPWFFIALTPCPRRSAAPGILETLCSTCTEKEVNSPIGCIHRGYLHFFSGFAEFPQQMFLLISTMLQGWMKFTWQPSGVDQRACLGVGHTWVQIVAASLSSSTTLHLVALQLYNYNVRCLTSLSSVFLYGKTNKQKILP